MVQINRNEAPEGYVAKATIGWSCVGCAFRTKDDDIPCTAPSDPSCGEPFRKDKQTVIFVKKESTI